MSDLTKALKSEKIRGLKLRNPVCVARATPLREVFALMLRERKGYAVVLEDLSTRKIAGIFTERDVMNRVVEQKLDDATQVQRVMTPNPKTLHPDDTVADAIRLMNQGRYRHLPLVDDEGRLAGVLGVRDLIQYLAEHYPYEVYNLPPDPHQVIRAPEGA